MEAVALSRASRFGFTSPKGCANHLHLRRQCRRSSIHLPTAYNFLFRFKTTCTFHSAFQSSGNSDNGTARTANNNDSIKIKANFEALLKGWKWRNENMEVFVEEFIRRFMALALVLVALGFIPLQRRVFAAPAAAMVGKNNIHTQVDDDICAYERELNEAITLLQQRLQEVRVNEDKDKVQRLQDALHLLTAKTLSMRSDVLIRTAATTRRMKKLEAKLLKEVEQVAKSYLKAKRELDKVVLAHGDEKSKEICENEVRDAEDRYRVVWSALSKLEADLVAKETEGLRFAFQQIPAIQEKVDHLFQSKLNTTSTSEYQRLAKQSTVARIRKDLDNAIKKTWERMILPDLVDLEEPELPLDEERRKTLECINIDSLKSREMQGQLDSVVRDQLKGAGEEKLLLVVTPQEDVVKGFPPVELKWLFGDTEVHVPGAASFHMAQGWKKWREEAKANLKKKLLEDVEFGKRYVAERQARILLYHNRVITNTWYNVREKRWEIDPVAASYAVTKELVGRARIRHDWALMYIVLKGDDREYYVDIQEFNALFEQVGGFDRLYVKMMTSGIPTTVEFMWIPFKEWDLSTQFMIAAKILYRFPIQIWNSNLVSKARTWYVNKFILIFDDFMAQEGFDFYYKLARKKLYDSVWFLEWRIRTEKRFKRATAGSHITESRVKRRGSERGKGVVGDLFWWFLKLSMRFLFYAYPLLLLFPILREKYSRICEALSSVFFIQNANPEVALRRGLKNKFLKRKGSREQKADTQWGDINVAFDRMKRIRNPPLHLKDIAGIDAVKDEVMEVVTFLKNPKYFQEMGARAPRGILILGDSETPKETLVLAIAAEAKVPLVEVRRTDFTGLSDKVGEGPSRVRELFQTARDLAPLIIFMEDFDSFAGSRGEINETKMKFRDARDHEAIINQFLVELDGFETKEGVVFIASAERPEAIDEAIRRPGRIDRTFTMSLPNEKERVAILQAAAKSTMHGDLIDWEKVAGKTFGLSASQVESVAYSLEFSAYATKTVDDEELFSIYGWLATIGNVTPDWLKKSKWTKKLNAALIDWLGLQLTKEDMESAVQLMEPYDMISPGLELDSPPFTWTREFKLPHAVWAAGRGLVALLLPSFHSVDLIWLEPNCWKGVGFTKFTAEVGGDLEDVQEKSRSHLEKQLVLCFGSYVAARLLLPSEESNNLSRLEIEEARRIATQMVLEYGWGPDDNHMVYWTSHLDYKGNLNLGKVHKIELEAKIEKLFNMACDKAAELLLKNRRALDALVEHLLEYDVVNKQGMMRILEENGAVQEPDPFMFITYKNYESTAGMATNGTGRVSAAAQHATSGF